MATYTVVRGDCLWNIAKSKLGNALRWTEIADLNGISRSKPTIYPGQTLQLPGSSSGGSSGGSTTTAKKVTPVIEFIGLEAGTDTLFATWSWDKSNTASYNVRWEYYTLNKRWFRASENDTSTTLKESTYNPPSNAIKVRVRVQAVSKTKTVNNKEVSYWSPVWSASYKTYDLSDSVLTTPSAPSLELDGLSLKMRLDNLSNDASHIIFEITQDDNKVIYTTGKTSVKITTSVASYTHTVSEGHKYKVRCRAYDSDNALYSEWSPYSSNIETKPLAPKEITVCKAVDENSIRLEWTASTTAKTYDVEYTTNKDYFDISNSTTTVSGIEGTIQLITNLDTGKEYFFRVRANNGSTDGESDWSGIVSVVLGTTPTAPTTWSSTTTGIVGEKVTLHWMHNCEDGSAQTYAKIKIYANGVELSNSPITMDTTSEEDDDKTMYYDLDTSQFTEGTQIQWEVCTAGVTLKFGEYSVQRTIDIYAKPTLTLSLMDANGNSVVNSTLETFPLYISGIAGPATQTPIGYHVSITSGSSYETVDSIGNTKNVIAGEEVYSKYYDTSENLLLELSAGSVDFESEVEYTVTCIVSMDSGLTATATADFTVVWSDEQHLPNAEIGVNENDISVYIRPYCEDDNGELIANITLAVYRREYDGTFVEIAKGIDNLSGTYVTDPHPALDFARYRIVATATDTGAVSYYDIPPYPIQEKSIVIQWNEEWKSFNTDNEDELSESPRNGSLLKLLYNIDVDEKKSPDISLVKYVGRKHPVSYYGTQIGETADWKAAIPKSDTETVYALRRLAVWMGDVYVREPSGTGYWANVSVTFNQNHTDLTIPITISVTRVEGGV